MIEIMTQTGNDEGKTFNFTKDFPPLRSLKMITILILQITIYATIDKKKLTVKIANIIWATLKACRQL